MCRFSIIGSIVSLLTWCSETFLKIDVCSIQCLSWISQSLIEWDKAWRILLFGLLGCQISFLLQDGELIILQLGSLCSSNIISLIIQKFNYMKHDNQVFLQFYNQMNIYPTINLMPLSTTPVQIFPS